VRLAPWGALLCRGVDFWPLYLDLEHIVGPANSSLTAASFGFRLRLELLNLTTLLLDLLLLRIYL